MLVNQSRESVEFDQGILQRRSGQQQLPAVGDGRADGLAHLIASSVRTTEFMGLVNHDEVPRHELHFARHPAGEVH